MLVELAIGDAYGAGFEYAPRNFTESFNTLENYVQHPRHGTPPGCYTDDTQMAIAIAEALISGEEWTPQMLAGKFVSGFHRDPREGYAQSFYGFLRRTQTAEAFLENIRPTSEKSGAAMRAAPLGVLPDVPQIIAKSRVQAAITHNTPKGIAAATAVALASHYFVYDVGPKSQLGRWLNAHVPAIDGFSWNWNEPWTGKVGGLGVMSVSAAIFMVRTQHSMAEILQRIVNLGGDTDTAASIAMACAASSREIHADLPGNLFDELENDGEFGRDYLIALDAKLAEQVRP